MKARLLPVLGGDEAALDGVATEVGENTKSGTLCCTILLLTGCIFSSGRLAVRWWLCGEGEGYWSIVIVVLGRRRTARQRSSCEGEWARIAIACSEIELEGCGATSSCIGRLSSFGAAENSGMDADGSSVLLLISVPSRSRLFP